MIVNGMSKSSNIFQCEICHYYTSRVSQYERHLTTLKHQKRNNDSSKSSKSSKKEWECECGKKYKYDSGLYRHKKQCNYNETIKKTETCEKITENCKEMTEIKNQDKEFKELKNLVIEVMKSNNELQKQNYELQKQVIEI